MRARGPLIAGIAAGVIALLLIVLLVLPKMGQVGETRDQLGAAQDQEIQLQAELRSLQDAQAQAPQTEEEIRVLEAQVPTTADLPGLFRLLQGAADRAAVDFFQFSPGTPTADATGSFSTVSGQIVVNGSYFSLENFLTNLETLERASKVISVGISPVAATTGTTTTTTTTVTTASGRLQMQLAVEFYTTDSSAGPGSEPGPTEGVAAVQTTSTETQTTTEPGTQP